MSEIWYNERKIKCASDFLGGADLKNKIISFLLAIMLLLSAAGCGDKENENDMQNVTGNSEVVVPAEPKLPAKSEEISAQIDAISKDNTAVGTSVVAFENGEITYTHHCGYANKAKELAPDDSTQYRIASLSKFISAITVMTAVDDGYLTLDDDIGYYLGYQVRNPKYTDTKITMRHLLSHSSSIGDTGKFDNGDYSSNKALLRSSSPYLNYAPGEGYEYSNFGLQTAGNVTEKATGETFHDYAEERVFAPLGITASYLASTLADSSHIAVVYDANGNVSRSVDAQLGPKRTRKLGELRGVVQGSLTITPTDYAKLILMVLNGGEYNGVRVLSKESADEILKTQYEDENVNYCLCVRKNSSLVDGRTLYCHSGEAFGILSGFAFDKDAKSGVVVVTNGAKQNFNDATGLSVGCTDIIKAVFEGMK